VGQGGFGFNEAAFDGGFEDGGFVAFEVGFDALEVGDGFVEAGELFFEFGDDFALLANGGNGISALSRNALGTRRKPTAPVMCRAASLRKVWLETKWYRYCASTLSRGRRRETRGAKANAVLQVAGHGHLAVFHARRDLGKQNVAIAEVGVALLHFGIRAKRADINAAVSGSHSGHGHE
jgi:hypothetical protein